MKKSLFNIVVSSFALLIIFSLQGCSLAGFGIGAIADKGKTVVDQDVATENVWIIESGSHVEVVDKGGIIYRGDIEKVENVEIYSGELQRVVWLKSEGRLKPVLLDNIDRITIRGKKKNAKWVGLGLGVVIDAAIITAIAISIENGRKPRGDAFRDWWNINIFGGN